MKSQTYGFIDDCHRNWKETTKQLQSSMTFKIAHFHFFFNNALQSKQVKSDQILASLSPPIMSNKNSWNKAVIIKVCYISDFDSWNVTRETLRQSTDKLYEFLSNDWTFLFSQHPLQHLKVLASLFRISKPFTVITNVCNLTETESLFVQIGNCYLEHEMSLKLSKCEREIIASRYVWARSIDFFTVRAFI